MKPRRLGAEHLESRLLLSTTEFRSIEGSGNNRDHPEWGEYGATLLRIASPEYADGISEPSGGGDGSGRPNPRAISNRVAAQSRSLENDRELSGFVFQWGQFLDHDVGLTPETHPVEDFSVPTPAGDPDLNPDVPIPLLRSLYDPSTGTDRANPRQQVNQITAFIDASNVYGSDAERADQLRLHSGGKLKTSEGDLLPFNESGLPNAAPPPLAAENYFLAGDVRANEQPGLTSLHTLFVREHNRLAEQIAARDFAGASLDDPDVDEAIYQQARRLVAAQMQAVTYHEFLPALLGPNGVPSYTGYDPQVNPGIANIFSSALYRVGHTMLPDELLRLKNSGRVVAGGNLSLGEAFFDPAAVTSQGIEPYLKGLSVQRIQEIDSHLVDGVRNLLFAPPAQFDLAAINIQRGRDHGLPDYNQARVDLGLEPVVQFAGITPNRRVRQALRDAYDGELDNIDVWLGGISEKHIPGGSVGELVWISMVDQFQRSRDGDRFYFENDLSGAELEEIKSTRLSDIIRRNTGVFRIQDEVFRTEQVLVYRAAAAAGAVDVTLRVAAGDVQVVDNHNQRVLQSRPLRETASVVLFGSDDNDRLVLDLGSQRMRDLPIEVHGGGGWEDQLVVLGTRAADRATIHPSRVVINGNTAYFGNIENVVVHGAQGNDRLASRGGAAVTAIMEGGAGRDVLIGSRFTDVLMGGDGGDVLLGRGGNDLMMGGHGQDRMKGGQGGDMTMTGDPESLPPGADLISLIVHWNARRQRNQTEQSEERYMEVADMLLASPEYDWLSQIVARGW